MRPILTVVKYLLLPIIIGLGLALLVQDDSGYVLITGTVGSHPFTLETTFIGAFFSALFIFIAFYLVLRLLSFIINMPRRWRYARSRRRQLVAERRYAKAQLLLMDNKAAQAEELFAAAAKYSLSPEICFIGAAEAAQAQNSVNRRDHYLSQIDNMDANSSHFMLASIQRAELLVRAKDAAKARKMLESLRVDLPYHPYVLSLLIQTYWQQQDFLAMYELLPNAYRILSKQTEVKIADDIYEGILSFAASQKDTVMLKEVWEYIPKESRESVNLVLHYAAQLLHTDLPDEADAVLRQAIKRKFDERLVQAYGQLYRGNIKQQLKYLLQLDETHSRNAYVSLAIARLSLRDENWEQAQRYLEKSLSIQHLPEALELLAQIKLQQGDKEGALLAYQKVTAQLLHLPEVVQSVELLPAAKSQTTAIPLTEEHAS